MDANAFLLHAQRLLSESDRSGSGRNEADLRRAISSSYYALFHSLTTVAAAVFSAGNAALQVQVARAFGHAAMLKVCEAYIRSPQQPLPPHLRQLHSAPIDPRLIGVADAFRQLQDARHSADYDLGVVVETKSAVKAVELASRAISNLQDIRTDPDTTVFLTALLLADRWSRRG